MYRDEGESVFQNEAPEHRVALKQTQADWENELVET